MYGTYVVWERVVIKEVLFSNDNTEMQWYNVQYGEPLYKGH